LHVIAAANAADITSATATIFYCCRNRCRACKPTVSHCNSSAVPPLLLLTQALLMHQQRAFTQQPHDSTADHTAAFPSAAAAAAVPSNTVYVPC